MDELIIDIYHIERVLVEQVRRIESLENRVRELEKMLKPEKVSLVNVKSTLELGE